MPTEKQIDAATEAYLKSRGWTEETIKSNPTTRTEVRGRISLALLAAEKAEDAQNPA